VIFPIQDGRIIEPRWYKAVRSGSERLLPVWRGSFEVRVPPGQDSVVHLVSTETPFVPDALPNGMLNPELQPIYWNQPSNALILTRDPENLDF